jgi:uncharacterized membrane protein
MIILNICLENKNIMSKNDKDFLDYLNENFPNYDNEWVFDLLYSIVEKYKLLKE